MPIIKNHIDFGHDFTMLPNQWVRDARLSHRARGVLAVVMSHKDGWETSISHLVQNGKEGRDAIYSAVGELVELGYLKRTEVRSATGKFEGADYEVRNPFTENPQPLPEKPYPDYPYTGKPYPANPQQENTNLKKTNYKENQLQELPQTPSAPHQSAGTVAASGRPQTEGYTQTFLQFWKAYPVKKAKGAAFKAWKRIPASEYHAVIAGATFYAADPNREHRFTKHPATWLNGRCWEDETPEPNRVPQKVPGWVARDQANQQFANAYLNQQQPAGGPEPLGNDWIAGELA